MKSLQSSIRGTAAALLCLASLVRGAQAFTVDELGVSPGETATISVTGFYTGEVSVGVLKLVVDGVAADGFCIDPYHFSLSSSAGYEFRALAMAPKLPGTMGATKAEAIRKLWAMAYSPNMTSEEAAGLQLAIWETVAGDNFSVSGNDYGASFCCSGLKTTQVAAQNSLRFRDQGRITSRFPTVDRRLFSSHWRRSDWRLFTSSRDRSLPWWLHRAVAELAHC